MPVVSYSPPKTAWAPQCAPSYTLRTGSEREIPLIQQALARGWAVLAPDYEGPNRSTARSHQAGHAVLDSIRAIRRFQRRLGADSPVGIWATPAARLRARGRQSCSRNMRRRSTSRRSRQAACLRISRRSRGRSTAARSRASFAAAQGLERAYPEMDVFSVLNEEGRALLEEISDKCVSEITDAGAFKRTEDLTTVPDVISLPRIQAVLEQNHLGRRAPAVPTYVYHAIADQLIPIATVDKMIQDWCNAGVTVEYYRDPASEHVALVATGATAALGYLQARFAGEPAPSTCPEGLLAHADPTVGFRFKPRAFERRTRLRVDLSKPARVELSVAPARR